MKKHKNKKVCHLGSLLVDKKSNIEDSEYHTISLVLVVMGIVLAAVVEK